MSLPTTGLTRFSDVQNIFGGTNPIFLSEYYNNSSSGYVNNNNNIPSNGFISIRNFLGQSRTTPTPAPTYTWQYFNNSYVSSGEFALRNNPSYIAVYIYDGTQTPAGTWQVSYVSSSATVTQMYNRYGSMTRYEPNNRYVYIHIQRCTNAGVYQTKTYATLVN